MKLIELQDVDVKLDQLRHQLANLPESKRVVELESTYADLELSVGTAQAKVADTGREVKKAEESVNQVRIRIARDQELLDSGSVTSPKQLEDLQHEVASLQRRQADLEDEQLEVMEAAENAEKEAADFTQRAVDVAHKLESAREEEERAQGVLADEANEANAERAKISDSIGLNDLTQLYEKLRADHGGVVAARLKNERCGACNLQLSPADVKALHDAPEDEVHRCDECRSILVLDGKK